MKIRFLAGAAVFLLLASGGIGWLLYYQKTFDARYIIFHNPFLQNFLHTYRSFKRVSNIAFFPYWFGKSGLPQYELVLDPKEIIRLNEHLPRNPIDGLKLQDDQFDVKGYFITSTYEDTVKVRYQGLSANHWNAEQRSFRIEFPKEHLFRGMRVLRLVIPHDRQYFIESLNMYRAKKFGLRVPELSFVELKLKGKSSGGVYLAFEGFNQEWLEKNEYAGESLIFSLQNNVVPDPAKNPPSLFSEDGATRWQLANRKDILAEKTEELTALRTLLYADEKTFERLAPHLIDIEQFYGWEMLNILAASGHQSDYWNLVMVFNSSTGRFEFIPREVGIYFEPPSVNIYLQEPTTLIAKRILSIPKFRNEFRKRLATYVNNPENLRDDVRFYDGLFERTRTGFYKDNAKFYSTFVFRKQVGDYRNAFISYFEETGKALSAGDGAAYRFTGDVVSPRFQGSFKKFGALAASQLEFLFAYPSFYALEDRTLLLGPGVYSFRETVLIPDGFRVRIQPGTDIYLGEGASFVSWSPIDARGSAYAPIRVRRFSPQKPFGVFGVVNTGEQKNYFSYFDIEGGFQDAINGMVLKGQMSVHNSDVEIRNSRFAGAAADDAINVVYRNAFIADSLFENNASDNIDLDFVEGSIVNSRFKNPEGGSNGDAIDISGGRVEIAGNIIEGCGDKGLSIGERTFARVRRNVVSGCAIGVAVKDSSEAFLTHNTFLLNKIAVEAYQKKPIFGGGKIWMAGTVVWGNENDISLDKKSSLVAMRSVFERGLEGEGNTREKPDFSKLLPASIYDAVKDRL